ncbi:restriction endonuclease subunit S [Paenirhodobacter enshiensis]|uniref:Type I restriction modification DNA specificity domain-containing protein n=1 Tax=Paenirhodobacter enshiensis TaxID=1105367 RepID=A0A086Y9G0_9RHOB|nr:restriction endonuclease subunit S [Paenirhodobacter enshiensis]KFI30910.1 hypothetical protein CG50_04250 [Paenirhodobacter enshiensis]
MSSKEKSSAVAASGAALVPKLRFPEFEETDGWKEIPLQKLARPVTDRATTGDADNVLSLSGEHGLVLQSEYFGKKIAGDNTDRYLKIRKDDFVYNDRTTKASGFGTIKRLSAYAGGIVSPIYKCFRFHPSENPAFWEWYFESGSHNPALGGLVNEGARAGRFNISVTQFLSTNAWRPDEAEQQKIADCLDSADALIAAQGRKVEALRAHKKGLMQQLFPQEGETQPRLRFPEFEGAGEWVPHSLKQVTTALLDGDWIESKDQSEDGFRLIQTGNIGVGDFIAKSGKARFVSNETFERLRCTEVFPGDCLVSRLPDPLGRSCFIPDIGERMITAVDCLIVRFDETKIVPRLFVALTQTDAYFRNVAGLSSGSTRQRISKENLSNLSFIIPPTIFEQQRIADCLTSLDDLIAAETRKLDTLKTHKKGLMQQLFPQAGEYDA